MRLLCLIIGYLVLARSDAFAQASTGPASTKEPTIRFTDLVGKWAEQDGDLVLTYRADSTFVGTDGQIEWSGRWRLAGDTIMMARVGNGGTGALGPEKPVGLLTLDGSVLTKKPLGQGGKTQVFERQ